MPTVILLDVSLSMFRPIPSSDATETQTRISFAFAAINSFLDYLSVNSKLEYVSLVTFSSSFDVAVPFTREFDTIRTKLPQLEEGDKTCLDAALAGINHLILNEWGSQISMQIILITDGSCGTGVLGREQIIQTLPLPPSYPAKIHVLPIAAPQETSLQIAMPLYQKLVELAYNANFQLSSVTASRGAVYTLDQLTLPAVLTSTSRLCEQQYSPWSCVLKCGQLESKVWVQPPPPCPRQTMHVIGFIPTQHLGSPITMSKHLIIPQAQLGTSQRDGDPKTPTKEGANPETPDEDSSDPSKVPNFCVLLHGALKVENMSALLQLAPDWYGAVSAWCESSRARRSCLLISVLRRGGHVAPWLGPLGRLGPNEGAVPEGEVFPVRASRSYNGGGGGGWSRSHALIADVQKVLRHARKLPDKTHHLYKELNRLRKAAISLGFTELLQCVAVGLEREAAVTRGEVHAQLSHAARLLADDERLRDLTRPLVPLATPCYPQHTSS